MKRKIQLIKEQVKLILANLSGDEIIHNYYVSEQAQRLLMRLNHITQGV